MRVDLTVRLTDCDVQTFRAGGKGGQNQNKRNTGVRIIHRPSGAVGEARDERSQLQNKRLAFRRMAESTAFKSWANSHYTQIKIEPATERIRTYNLVDQRVTDHRTKHTSTNVQAILDGDLDVLYR